MTDNIIWVWDLDENRFIPLIDSGDAFEQKTHILFYNYTNLQQQKVNNAHKDLLDELKKLFGDIDDD